MEKDAARMLLNACCYTKHPECAARFDMTTDLRLNLANQCRWRQLFRSILPVPLFPVTSCSSGITKVRHSVILPP
jgi:hypothetical protein